MRHSVCGLALLVWLASCSCRQTAAPDAGDAGDAGDAARDSVSGEPRDASLDLGRDSSGDTAADTSLDAGPIGEAGWVPMPGYPEGCSIERATRPEVLFEPLWLSCGAGCQYLAPEPRFQRTFDTVGWHDGTQWWFVVIQSSDAQHREVIFAPDDGLAIAAWRGPGPRHPGVCQIGPTALADNAAAFGVRVLGEGLPDQFRLYHASLDDIGHVTAPVAIRDPSMGVGSRGVQDLSVSRTTVAAEVQPAGVVIVFEGGASRILGGLASAVPGNPQHVRVVGRTVWWEEWSYPISLVTGSLAQEATYFRRTVPDDVLVLGVDDGQMAWLEGYGWVAPTLPHERTELWTAAYTDDPAALAPRLLREVDSWGPAVLGGGVYAFYTSDVGGANVRIELYDIADGRRRVFRSPEGVGVADRPLAITADEMLLKGRFEGVPTLFRITLASIPYDE